MKRRCAILGTALCLAMAGTGTEITLENYSFFQDATKTNRTEGVSATAVNSQWTLTTGNESAISLAGSFDARGWAWDASDDVAVNCSSPAFLLLFR